MDTCKIFNTGRSQAIRIPKKYRFNVSEVSIRKSGNEIILAPIDSKEALRAFLAMPPVPDFELDRSNAQTIQNREFFK